MNNVTKIEVDQIANKAIQDFIASDDFKEIVKGICDEVKVPINISSGGDMVLIPEARDQLGLEAKSTALSAAASKGKLPFLHVGPRKRMVSLEVCKMYLNRASHQDIWMRWKEIIKDMKK